MNMKLSEPHASSTEAQWYYPGYPGDPDAPRGVKIQMLNAGGVTILGVWPTDGKGVVAWAPMIQRNSLKEDYLKGLQNELVKA